MRRMLAGLIEFKKLEHVNRNSLAGVPKALTRPAGLPPLGIMRGLERRDVKSRAQTTYDSTFDVWPESDTWSSYTKRILSRVVHELGISPNSAVLNAGCGGNDYGIAQKGAICVNLDLSFEQCRNMRHSIVADVEEIPLANNWFDFVLCVGAVMNYCEPYAAVAELFRVAKPNGTVVIDFETTTSAELLFSKHWGKRVSVIERKYADRLDKTLLFSADHVRRIIKPYGTIVKLHRYHIATAFWLRMNHRLKIPNAAIKLDRVATRIPGLRALASNFIFVCRKR
jgi:SAM-dependent methyltransferase